MYKNQLGEALKEKQKQDELHKKHNIDDKNIKIVEKRSLLKFLIKVSIALIKVVVTIIFILLASVGITALYYQDTRQELMTIFFEIVNKL